VSSLIGSFETTTRNNALASTRILYLLITNIIMLIISSLSIADNQQTIARASTAAEHPVTQRQSCLGDVPI
jgi:hypothetical protein